MANDDVFRVASAKVRPTSHGNVNNLNNIKRPPVEMEAAITESTFVQFSNENYICGKYLVHPNETRCFRNWHVIKKVRI